MNDLIYKEVEQLSERYLLAYAGKSVGYMLKDWHEETVDCYGMYTAYVPVKGRESEFPSYWSEEGFNSLVYDADALDLALLLGISIDIWPECVYAVLPRTGMPTPLLGIKPYCVPIAGTTRRAAMCKAITVVAATIGKYK